MVAFAHALPAIRKRVAADQRRDGLPREKVLAAVVGPLERTRIRVGNEEYARENRSFGLTTLRNRHAKVRGARAVFTFQGKSGREHSIPLTDRRLATIVKRCQELPGQVLFQHLDVPCHALGGAGRRPRKRFALTREEAALLPLLRRRLGAPGKPPRPRKEAQAASSRPSARR